MCHPKFGVTNMFMHFLGLSILSLKVLLIRQLRLCAASECNLKIDSETHRLDLSARYLFDAVTLFYRPLSTSLPAGVSVSLSWSLSPTHFPSLSLTFSQTLLNIRSLAYVEVLKSQCGVLGIFRFTKSPLATGTEDGQKAF